MDNSMMNSILGMVTPEIKNALASRLGESTQTVTGGLGAATAATLAGLASRAGEGGFLNQIVGLVGSGSNQNILGSLASIAAGAPSGAADDLVNRFLPLVFGSQQAPVANAISQQTGVSASSATGLLKMAAPLVLGYLSKLHSNGSLNAGSLGTMLRSELPSLQSYLPGSLLGGALGTVGATAGRTVTAVESGINTAGGASWRWLIVVVIVVALLLAWLLPRSCSGPKDVTQTAADTVTTAAGDAATAVGTAATAAWAKLGEMTKLSLPDGTTINAPALGVEGRLVSYLNDSSAPVSEDKWFNFDRLLFDTGAATLQPASQEQLTNIAAILKAFPKAKVHIGGYTDNTGDAGQNLKLSQERAESVVAELTKLGVDPSRMEAKGYGEEHPVADNSTEDGRQQNRRIALRVTEK
jgi:OmpA-OmpF porin, OOP family